MPPPAMRCMAGGGFLPCQRSVSKRFTPRVMSQRAVSAYKIAIRARIRPRKAACRHQLRQQEEIERADRHHKAKAQQHTQQHACALLCRLRLVDPVEVAVAQILHQPDVRRQQHEQQLTGQQQRRLCGGNTQHQRGGEHHDECRRDGQRIGQIQLRLQNLFGFDRHGAHDPVALALQRHG